LARPFDFLYGEGQALAFIKQGFEKGLGVGEIKEFLETGGLKIGGEKVEKVFDYLSEVIKPSKEYIKGLPLNSTPNLTRIPLSLTKQLRNFSYQVEVQGFHRVTGKIITIPIWISSDQLLTKQQAIDQADELSTQVGDRYGLESGAGTVVGITQNVGGLVLP